MIQYLQRMRNKKGFTLVELIVVFAIIGVLAAFIGVNMIGGDNDKQLAASSNAKAFFTATQLTMTRAQLTERSVVYYESADTQYIQYVNGANAITGRSNRKNNYLFIEARFRQNGIVGVNISDTFDRLMSCDDPDATMTKLEAYISQNLSEYLADSYDGYFYAMVDNSFKVLFAHYCDSRLPQRSSYGSETDFRDAMMVNASGRLKGNDRVLGTCSDSYTLATTGQYVFDLPGSTEPNHELYFDDITPIS